MLLSIRERRLHFSITKENFPKLLVFLWLLSDFFLTAARFFLHRLNIEGNPREIVLFAVASFPILLLIRYYREDKEILKDSKLFFLIYIFSALSFLINYVFFPQYRYFYFRKEYGLLRVFRPDSAIYALLFFSILDDPKDFYKIIKNFSYLNFLKIFISVYIPRLIRGYWVDVNHVGAKVTRLYSLSFGYTLIFPTIVFLYVYMKEKKPKDLLLSILCIGMIFFQGSRGALFLPILFLIFMAISNSIHLDNKRKSLKKITIIIGVLGLIFLFKNEIYDFLINTFQNLGLKTRTITKLLESSITDDSGRNEIWTLVRKAIKDNWVFGYGAYGDRPFVFPEHFVGYSHNIVLEMVCSFGLVGVGILTFLLIQTIKMFLCKDRLWRELYIVFFTVSCQLFLSLSFWYVTEFWIMIAILYKYYRNNKRMEVCQKLKGM